MNNFSNLDIDERLVAKQAVLILRAFKQALRTAPPDQRIEALDRVVHRQGHGHLRVMMAVAIAAQDAQGTNIRLTDHDSATMAGRKHLLDGAATAGQDTQREGLPGDGLQALPAHPEKRPAMPWSRKDQGYYRRDSL